MEIISLLWASHIDTVHCWCVFVSHGALDQRAGQVGWASWARIVMLSPPVLSASSSLFLLCSQKYNVSMLMRRDYRAYGLCPRDHTTTLYSLLSFLVKRV